MRNSVGYPRIVPALIALPCLFLLLVSRSANAGWYHVTNYEGRVGEYPVHMSVQQYDSFGSGLNIEGSYYYDKNLIPIPLYGKLDGTGNLSLCEVHGDVEYRKVLVQGSTTSVDTTGCPFRLNVVDRSANGTWKSGARTYSVVLEKMAVLDNSSGIEVSGAVEIPFWGQSATHLFVGAYAREGTELHVHVKVVNKRTHKVVQELTPEQHDCDFGFFMTPIYMNIENYGLGNSEQVILNCYGSRGGTVALYRLNRAKKRFDFVSVK